MPGQGGFCLLAPIPTLELKLLREGGCRVPGAWLPAGPSMGRTAWLAGDRVQSPGITGDGHGHLARWASVRPPRTRAVRAVLGDGRPREVDWAGCWGSTRATSQDVVSEAGG